MPASRTAAITITSRERPPTDYAGATLGFGKYSDKYNHDGGQDRSLINKYDVTIFLALVLPLRLRAPSGSLDNMGPRSVVEVDLHDRGSPMRTKIDQTLRDIIKMTEASTMEPIPKCSCGTFIGGFSDLDAFSKTEWCLYSTVATILN